MSDLWLFVDELRRSQDLSENMQSFFHSESSQEATNPQEILNRIEKIILSLVISISEGDAPVLQHTNRNNWDNVNFSDSRGLEMRDDGQMTSVRFDALNSVNRLGLSVKLLSIIYKLVQSGTCSTKRDIYYQDPQLFGSQGIVDDIIDNIACMLGVPRWDLYVNVTSKGCISGDLTYEDSDGSYVNCSGSTNGVLISNNVRGLRNLRSNARAVIIVEKDATFQKLIDDGIMNIMKNVILVTGKGFPDVNTRLMVRRLWDECRIPTFALVDADPHGLEILTVYKYGSRSLSFESQHLIVPTIKWLGVLPSDIDRFSIPESSLLALTDADIDKAQSLLDRPVLSSNPTWVDELNNMLTLGMKAEIQSLASIGDDYLTTVYLPNKLKYAGWL